MLWSVLECRRCCFEYLFVGAAVLIKGGSRSCLGKTAASATRFFHRQRPSPIQECNGVRSLLVLEMPARPLPVGALEKDDLTEHGGYKCAGCAKIWTSLKSLSLHRAHRCMRGTPCADEESGRELRNVFRINLASGLAQERLIFQPGYTAVLDNL